jgi:serine/threonine protein kinase
MTDETLFTDALALPNPADRAAFFSRVCPDPAQRQRVEALLAAHHAEGSFLTRPAGANLASTAAYEPLVEEPGSRVGPYKLLQQIGEGGMGTVFMAEQEVPVRRKVALKIIKPGMDSKQVVARFEAERQALSMMDHPNIAKVLDAGTTASGRPYFVMELVHGVPITEFCDANKLTPQKRLELFVPICQAIQHAHMKGIIHRDIKPSNVLVTMYDDKPVPKVIDFGVAKAVEQRLTEKTLFTQYGALVGTFEYMSPEQAEMNAFGVDTRSDVYSLGVLLYELLTGSTPLERGRLRTAALGEVIRIIKEEEPPRPSQRLSTSGTLAKVAAARKTDPGKLAGLVRGELDWIVMRCLEKDRTRRYETATGLAKDVQRYLAGDAVEACPPTLGYRLKKAYRKKKTQLWIGAIVSSALMLGVVGLIQGYFQASRAEKIAKANAEEALRAQVQAETERTRVSELNIDLRLSKYASDMNLIQAAADAKDFHRVPEMLDRLRPKAGEPDVRGPEWHFWNRRFHSHDRELKISCPRPPANEVGLSDAHIARFSPSGETVLFVINQPSGEILLRQFETAQHLLLKEIVIPSNGPRLRSSPDTRMHFSSNGKQVILERLDPKDYSSKFHYRAWLIDLASGGVKPIEIHNDSKGVFENSAFFSDDLSIVMERTVDRAKRTSTIRVRPVEGGPELGQITVSGYINHCWLAPDRKHLFVCVFPKHYRLGDNGSGYGTLQNQDIGYQAIGSDRPLWQLSGTGHLTRIDQLACDGDVFRQLIPDGNLWVLRTSEVKTGRVLESVPVAPRTEAGGHRMADTSAPKWVLSADKKRIAYQTPDGIGITDLGVVPTDSSRSSGRNARFTIGSPEATHTEIAFLPNNRLGSVLQPLELRMARGQFNFNEDNNADWNNEFILRSWALPTFASEFDQATRTIVTSPSGTFFALCPKVRTEANPKNSIERLCVMNALGQCIFRADLGPYSIDDQNKYGSAYIGFSQEERYVYAIGRSDRFGRASDSKLPFIVWELASGKEIARVEPPGGTRFMVTPYAQRLSSLISPDEQRILLPLIKDEFEPLRFGFGSPSSQVIGFLAAEFPSGRILQKVEVSDDFGVLNFEYDGTTITGHNLSNLILAAGTKIPIYRWNASSGEYLGSSTRTLTQPWQASMVSPPQDRWEFRGQRAMHQKGKTVEVWDANRRGPEDKPLFTCKTFDFCSLSPDGTRLLIRDARQNSQRLILLCTTTGREVFVPPNNVSVHDHGFARWSPDGQFFWYGVDGDGKPVGYDFRPRGAGK